MPETLFKSFILGRSYFALLLQDQTGSRGYCRTTRRPLAATFPGSDVSADPAQITPAVGSSDKKGEVVHVCFCCLS